MDFVNYDGQRIILEQEIQKCLNDGYEYKIYIGTDSQVKLKEITYATVVVLHKQTKGGRVFIKKKKEKGLIHLSQRLKNETWLSLETAFFLSEKFGNKIEIIIHIDCNADKKYKSEKYLEGLVGMVVGQGFRCFVKPDSFVAQKVADKFSR